MEQKQRAIEAHHLERISKLNTNQVDTLDAQYLVLIEIRDLQLQLLDSETTKAGKVPPKRDPLPKAEYSKGKRRWRWFT